MPRCRKCGKKRVYATAIKRLAVSKLAVTTMKYALLITGPVYDGNRMCTGHIETAKKLAKILSTKYNYLVDVCSPQSNVVELYHKFMKFIQQSNVQGLISYVGHGSQYSIKGTTHERWDFGGIDDVTLSRDLSMIGSGSCAIVISDSCFSDGMIDIPRAFAPGQEKSSTIVFLSSARCTGPDETRSAVFDSEGGYMTHTLVDILSTSANFSVDAIFTELVNLSHYWRPNNTLSKDDLHIPRMTQYPIGNDVFI